MFIKNNKHLMNEINLESENNDLFLDLQNKIPNLDILVKKNIISASTA